MAEFSASGSQTVAPGAAITFTLNPVPSQTGLVRWRQGSGSVLLTGIRNRINNCCRRGDQSTNYMADFAANIAVPTGGTAEEISVAFAVDGVVLSDTIMRSTPTELEAYNMVSRATNIPIWNTCCQSVSVINTSTQDILVDSPNLVLELSRYDLNRLNAWGWGY